VSAKKITRSDQKAQTRTLLLDAAKRCFEERGYHATGVGDVSRAAGVAHGTFYVHFPSKEAVADEILDEFNQDLARMLSPVLLGGERGLTERVRASARLFLERLLRDRPFVTWYAERIAEGASPAVLHRGINPPLYELLSLALAQRAGHEVRARDRLVAHALLAMWIRVGLQVAFEQGPTRKEGEDVLTAMTVGALEQVLRGKK